MDLYQGYADDEQVGASNEAVEMTMEEFDVYRASCVDMVEQAKAALRLADDKDFQTIIMKAYCTDEPKRLSDLMASGKIAKTDFDACAEDIRAIGALRKFLSHYVEKGVIAEQTLEELEAARTADLDEENGVEA